MTYSQVVQPAKSRDLNSLLWPGLLAGSVLAAYIPTVLSLIDGPWQTEQEGHGPLIIAASLWLVWQSRERLNSAKISAAPVAGWIALLIGLPAAAALGGPTSSWPRGQAELFDPGAVMLVESLRLARRALIIRIVSLASFVLLRV